MVARARVHRTLFPAVLKRASTLRSSIQGPLAVPSAKARGETYLGEERRGAIDACGIHRRNDVFVGHLGVCRENDFALLGIRCVHTCEAARERFPSSECDPFRNVLYVSIAAVADRTRLHRDDVLWAIVCDRSHTVLPYSL